MRWDARGQHRASLRECVARLRSFHGTLLAYGGGQDPGGHVRPRFMELSGSGSARIAVVPVASYQDDTRAIYRQIFRDLGAADVWLVDPDRDQADDPVVDLALGAATGICITGGDQKQLVRVLGGTRTARCLYDRLLAGIPLYVTSAGTVALADRMVAGLDHNDDLLLAKGLGFLPGITIETHLAERNRYARLEWLWEQRVNALVIGMDENTGLVFEPRTSRGTVVGTGQVVLLSDEAPRWMRAGEVLDLGECAPMDG